jgi:hypothetical protein
MVTTIFLTYHLFELKIVITNVISQTPKVESFIKKLKDEFTSCSELK